MNAIRRARHAIRVYLARRRRQTAAKLYAAMCDAYFWLEGEIGRAERRLAAANTELKFLTGE